MHAHLVSALRCLVGYFEIIVTYLYLIDGLLFSYTIEKA